MARTILEVCAVDSGSDGSDVVVLEVIDPSSPFVGLFAWGTDLSEASESLARLVWADQFVHWGGDAGGRAEVAGVRIRAFTVHTFHAVGLVEGDDVVDDELVVGGAQRR